MPLQTSTGEFLLSSEFSEKEKLEANVKKLTPFIAKITDQSEQDECNKKHAYIVSLFPKFISPSTPTFKVAESKYVELHNSILAIIQNQWENEIGVIAETINTDIHNDDNKNHLSSHIAKLRILVPLIKSLFDDYRINSFTSAFENLEKEFAQAQKSENELRNSPIACNNDGDDLPELEETPSAEIPRFSRAISKVVARNASQQAPSLWDGVLGTLFGCSFDSKQKAVANNIIAPNPCKKQF